MKRENLFWGTALVLLGGLFFLKGFGIIDNVYTLIFPLGLILVGVWLLLSVYFPVSPSTEGQSFFEIDLEGASKVALELNYGAGQLEITSGASNGKALEALTGLSLSHRSKLQDDTLRIEVNAGPTFIPFLGPSGGAWRFNLTDKVPLELALSMGASNTTLDLHDLQVKTLKLETGASSTRIILPAKAGKTFVDLEGGAASLDIEVPKNVGLRLKFEGGVTALDIDPQRFPRQSDGFFQSADFETAENKVDINLAMGAGSIKVR